MLNVLDVNCALVSTIFNIYLELRCRATVNVRLQAQAIPPTPQTLSDRRIYLLISPPQRPLCSARATMGRGKREERREYL